MKVIYQGRIIEHSSNELIGVRVIDEHNYDSFKWAMEIKTWDTLKIEQLTPLTHDTDYNQNGRCI